MPLMRHGKAGTVVEGRRVHVIFSGGLGVHGAGEAPMLRANKGDGRVFAQSRTQESVEWFAEARAAARVRVGGEAVTAAAVCTSRAAAGLHERVAEREYAQRASRRCLEAHANKPVSPSL